MPLNIYISLFSITKPHPEIEKYIIFAELCFPLQLISTVYTVSIRGCSRISVR
ncbi:protein of unknown function [Moritella yayanosii]|uniref:Uncharacterized protein n=1 Tax=Moritella yayanosii TaxID=69539 RepID=A0A330LMY5_9GAMM|nr:protein of unknown function [Moritella yayanosii]